MDEIRVRVDKEFYLPLVPHFQQIHYLNALEYNASLLIGVFDNSVSDDGQASFIQNLKKVYSQMSSDKRDKVFFTWANYKDLSAYDQRYVKKGEVPFVMIKEGKFNWVPSFFLSPGKECYDCNDKPTQTTTSSEDISTFVNKYLDAKLIPNMMMNENITEVYENSPKEKKFFQNLKVVKKINAA